MEEINRRSAMALGLATAAATPLFALATPAGAAEIVPAYGPNDGKEIAPGVRLVEVGTWHSDMTGIKSVQVLDAVFQPGAADKESVMDNDMICFITAGEFTIKKADKEFKVKKGEYYTCGKGKTDHATNISKEVGIHRITILIPA
jgi:mannose-6-phosphate isomerase-like protein (cupin superfamily)